MIINCLSCENHFSPGDQKANTTQVNPRQSLAKFSLTKNIAWFQVINFGLLWIFLFLKEIGALLQSLLYFSIELDRLKTITRKS